MDLYPRMRSKAIFLIVALGLVLTAFIFNVQKKTPESREITLRIAGVIPVFFEAQYGKRIHTENYDITIEFVPYELIPRNGDSVENLDTLLSTFQPDVVSWSGDLTPHIDQGLLTPLNAYLKREGSDALDIPAVLMQKVTSEGSNDMYAIPNRFSTEVLFYNASMLNQFGIELSETPPLSWDQLFQLAAAIPPEDGQGNAIIRFLETGADEPDANKVFSLIQMATLAENMQPAHKDNGNIYVNNENWKRIWQLMISSFNQKLISSSEDIKPFMVELDESQSLRQNEVQKFKPFLDGQAAFVLGNPALLYLLQREEPDFKWGLAPQPGTFQVFTQLSEVLLINPSSQRQDAAWELISYLSSAEQTKQSLLANPGDPNHLLSSLPFQMEVLEQHGNTSLAPFFSQSSSQTGYYDASPLPAVLSIAFYEKSILLIDEMLQGSLSIDEALKQLQSELELISNEIVESEDKMGR